VGRARGRRDERPDRSAREAVRAAEVQIGDIELELSIAAGACCRLDPSLLMRVERFPLAVLRGRAEAENQALCGTFVEREVAIAVALLEFAAEAEGRVGRQLEAAVELLRRCGSSRSCAKSCLNLLIFMVCLPRSARLMQ